MTDERMAGLKSLQDAVRRVEIALEDVNLFLRDFPEPDEPGRTRLALTVRGRTLELDWKHHRDAALALAQAELDKCRDDMENAQKAYSEA